MSAQEFLHNLWTVIQIGLLILVGGAVGIGVFWVLLGMMGLLTKVMCQ